MSVQMHIISFGKMTTEYKALYEHFRKMIRPQIIEHELLCRKPLDPDSLKVEEAIMAKKLLPKNAVLVALDPTGKDLTSEKLSEFIEKMKDAGRSIVFVIGGAYGLDSKIKDDADLVLSLSKMTMPHLLAKLVLIEQI